MITKIGSGIKYVLGKLGKRRLINPQTKSIFIKYIEDTYREKAPSNKTPTLSKSMNMDVWVVGTSNQRGS